MSIRCGREVHLFGALKLRAQLNSMYNVYILNIPLSILIFFTSPFKDFFMLLTTPKYKMGGKSMTLLQPHLLQNNYSDLLCY